MKQVISSLWSTVKTGVSFITAYLAIYTDIIRTGVFEKLYNFYSDVLYILKSIRVFSLFVVGSGIMDYAFWKVLEPYQNFKWFAVILVGLQVLHIAASLEETYGRTKA